MARIITVLIAAELIALPAGAQTPQQHLEESRQLLHEISPPPDTDLPKRIAALEQDFSELQTFYAATMQSRDGNPVAHTGPAPTEQAPVAPTTAAPQTPPPVRTNTGAAAPRSAGPAPRSPAQAVEPAPPPTVGIDPSTALQLLDRIQSVLDAAATGKSPTSVTPVGTSGTIGGKRSPAGGKVTIDRGLLDEIRA